MNTYKLIKKVMLVGITATALLSGCGNDTKQDTKQEAQQAAKVKEEAKKEEAKAKKEKEAKERAELEANKVEVERFNTCNAQGKYCERGMLNIGAFEALKVGMSPKGVAETLNRNADSATKTKMKDKATGEDVEVIEYTYNAQQTTVKVDFKDGALYYASHVDSNMKVTTLDSTETPAEEKSDAKAPAQSEATAKDTTSEGVKKSTDKPAPSKADTPAKSVKSAIPNDYCGHGHDETKELAHGCDKIIDEEAHQRHLQQQEREYEEQQREEAKKYELTEEDKARIQGQEKRWNTPSGGVGATWQDELKEMEEKEAQENAQQ
ncbi:hypothetical protein [Bacillus cereus]|uniref:hypothetical protein n=1 Tax=Bacillus cereus TaxID=1396 RepID=UPI0025A0796E|nr:hypothetical protein [Bacillus cereus]MDM5464402.1 hypothetical protein [Bacillus cereus]